MRFHSKKSEDRHFFSRSEIFSFFKDGCVFILLERDFTARNLECIFIYKITLQSQCVDVLSIIFYIRIFCTDFNSRIY